MRHSNLAGKHKQAVNVCITSVYFDPMMAPWMATSQRNDRSPGGEGVRTSVPPSPWAAEPLPWMTYHLSPHHPTTGLPNLPGARATLLLSYSHNYIPLMQPATNHGSVCRLLYAALCALPTLPPQLQSQPEMKRLNAIYTINCLFISEVSHWYRKDLNVVIGREEGWLCFWQHIAW